MTEPKTKFTIEPAPAEPPAFDFKYIASHWLVLISMPFGMIPLMDVAINPQAVWFLELIDLVEDQSIPGELDPVLIPTGEQGIRLHSVGGGEVELESMQCLLLEAFMKQIESELKKTGHPTNNNQIIESVGKPPSKIVAPWKK